MISLLKKTAVKTAFFTLAINFSSSSFSQSSSQSNFVGSISTRNLIGKVKADLYAKLPFSENNTPEYVVVFNPGANINPKAMNGFGEIFSEKNIPVYILHNDLNLAIIPTNHKKPLKLINSLSNKPESLSGFPEEMIQLHQDGVKIILMGHSVGGAVLNLSNSEITKQTVDQLVLLGASRVVGAAKPFEVPVKLIFGQLDGLIDKEKMQTLSKELDAELIELPDVNHFCFVSDSNAGSQDSRNIDQESPLDSEGCNIALLNSLEISDRSE